MIVEISPGMAHRMSQILHTALIKVNISLYLSVRNKNRFGCTEHGWTLFTLTMLSLGSKLQSAKVRLSPSRKRREDTVRAGFWSSSWGRGVSRYMFSFTRVERNFFSSTEKSQRLSVSLCWHFPSCHMQSRNSYCRLIQDWDSWYMQRIFWRCLHQQCWTLCIDSTVSGTCHWSDKNVLVQ